MRRLIVIGRSLVASIDPLADDQEALEASGLKALEIADWVIPGHGKRFANPGRD